MSKRLLHIAIAPLAVTLLAVAPKAETYLSGFVELTEAARMQSNLALDGGESFANRAYVRGDIRGQLRLSGGDEREEYFLRLDFLSDYARNKPMRMTIREGYVKLFLASWLDAKVGRQVATWGTGDLLFVNDLFAKDWVAFFTGQELSYLKLPQDLIRLSVYSGGTTIELAVSPYFTMDNLPTGERLSVFNPFLGYAVNASAAAPVSDHERTVNNAEYFLRLSGYFGSTEWALYGYHGFFPQPLGVRQPTALSLGQPVLFSPRLSSAGASLRGTVSSLLVSAEGALYFSEDDRDGDDPLLPNSAIKTMLGAEKNLGSEVTVSAQWFADLTLDYDKYIQPFVSSGAPIPAEELRNTLTLRLMKFLRNQTVKLSFFGYWGVSDEDYYLRPLIEYDYSDNTKITIGANILDGNQPNTMFGQFRRNSNVYLRLRRSF